VRRTIGGSPLNVAVGLAQLQRPASLLTWIGQDDDGHNIAHHLETLGVHLIEGSRAASHTPIAHAHISASGDASYIFDLEWDLNDGGTFGNPCVVHTGSIAAVLEPGCVKVEHILTKLAPQATVTYDPNIRPSIMGDARQVRARIEALVAHADVVKASEDDLTWLYADRSPLDTARRWVNAGPGIVVVTRGAHGAVGITQTFATETPAPKCTVRTTIGAGDSFMAGLIDALWSADMLGAASRASLASVSRHTLSAALAHASHVASMAISRVDLTGPTAQ
jgi:fructokinase